MAMTRKERFMTAVKVQQPDRVPMFDFLFQQPIYEAHDRPQAGGYNCAGRGSLRTGPEPRRRLAAIRRL